MRIQTTSFFHGAGWTEPIDPDLDSPQTLVLAFAGSRYGAEPAPFEYLRASLPGATIVGCSTAGEIHGTRVRDDSVSVAVLRFEHTTVRVATAPLLASGDSFTAGVSIGKTLEAFDLEGVLLFSNGDSLGVNGSELVRGINDRIHGSTVVTGGLAGDGSRFEKTWVVHEGQPHFGLVVAVGLYGPRVKIGHGSRGGWDIFGPERLVSRAAGNVLYALDGKPALQLYKEYLGDRAAGLPATGLLFPLALRASDASDKRLVRTILAVDEADQSLIFAGDIPQGSLAQLMRANFDRLVGGAHDAATRARGTAEPAGPMLSLAISCVGRRLVLGERVEEETEAVLEALPVGVRQVGFYSYGEISPYADGTCDLHNQTMTLTTVAED